MGARLARSTTESVNELDSVEVDQRKSLDWNDEKLLDHKSAINCLHNYALGKMRIAESPKSETKRRLFNALQNRMSVVKRYTPRANGSSGKARSSISFAKDLEQIFIIDSVLCTSAELKSDLQLEHADQMDAFISPEMLGKAELLSFGSKRVENCEHSPTCVTSFDFPGTSPEEFHEPLRFPAID
jgi:hypothetical protein